jgi:hypothetical protein
MNREDFKKILKPLIRQTVREVILEEGMLSGIISEVVRGMNTGVVMETKKDSEQGKLEEEYERKRQERIKRLNESVKVKADVFGNVPEIRESSPGSPLAGVAANDAGVDIAGILNIVDDKWKHMI